MVEQNADHHGPIRAKIRRWYVPGAVYFITAVTRYRRHIFDNEANLALLRSTMHEANEYHPFKMHAYVFLPDHFHLLILVPTQTNISKLMQSIQWNYTMNYKEAHQITSSLRLWQRGFWDHVIRGEQDYEGHLNYIHYNPVKHGYVKNPADYVHSSFREYAQRGWYGRTWAQDGPPAGLPEDASEPE